MCCYIAGLWPTWGKPSKIFILGYKRVDWRKYTDMKNQRASISIQTHTTKVCTGPPPSLKHTTFNTRGAGNFPSMHTALTRCMAELRGGCGSISNWDGVCPKLWICASVACGRERGEKERERERLSQSICIKVMGQCVTWQCKQILTQPCLWGRGEVKGKGSTPNPPGCSPFPPRPAESSKC